MSTKTHAESAPRSGGSLTHQPRRFAGLFLAPMAGLPIAWLIHVWTVGIDLHAGPINWTVPVGPTAEPIAITLLAWVTIGMCWVAWHFTAHRETRSGSRSSRRSASSACSSRSTSAPVRTTGGRRCSSPPDGRSP
jgi:hypothetical protein